MTMSKKDIIPNDEKLNNNTPIDVDEDREPTYEQEVEDTILSGNVKEAVGAALAAGVASTLAGRKNIHATRIKWIAIIIGVIVAAGVLFFGGKAAYGSYMAKKQYTESIFQAVTEVKKIGEFCTANYREETVIAYKRNKKHGKDEIAIIVRGTVRAGFDLAQMETEMLNDSSIVVTLPPAKVLDVISNPSDFETFEESGEWNHEQTTQFKNTARERILQHAMDDDLLGYAEEAGREQMVNLFSLLGFKTVTVNVAQPLQPTEELSE